MSILVRCGYNLWKFNRQDSKESKNEIYDWNNEKSIACKAGRKYIIENLYLTLMETWILLWILIELMILWILISCELLIRQRNIR